MSAAPLGPMDIQFDQCEKPRRTSELRGDAADDENAGSIWRSDGGWFPEESANPMREPLGRRAVTMLGVELISSATRDGPTHGNLLFLAACTIGAAAARKLASPQRPLLSKAFPYRACAPADRKAGLHPRLGSGHDRSGRIRLGPAALGFAAPEPVFLANTKVGIG